ncbi:axin interactor, dorsalization-associated protein-like isoform X2 [Macrobrachium nipponense]|uniref:axin interactor, dorsalization-associated protein-like isoform X2 n=1 Tax=Macrobrachium nipponense TaxID=159736 RepID=UPI0030C890E0
MDGIRIDSRRFKLNSRKWYINISLHHPKDSPTSERLNRNITKGAIYDYEQISCDQKKLLGQVLTCLDMRTQQLRIKLEGSRAQICKPGLASTGPLSKDAITSTAETMALNELTKCLEVLDTIRRMVSKTKVPVVLVYRERKHRTQHRHEEKGQSNKVVFPKEKRDFLSLMGLPGSMFSEKGFDFTVRPNTATALRKLQEEEAQNNRDNQTRDTTDVGEIEPDEKNGGTAVQVEDDDTDSPKTTKKNLLTYLPFMKRTSVAPHPELEDAEGRDIEEAADDEEEEEGEEEEAADARSTLSCDTCSSAGSSDTEEELEDVTDTPVAGATYAHKESVLPPPFKEIGSTYITLGLEKVGLKNTGRIVCPFIRVSVRDSQGNILSPESTQESGEWEIINRNYLRAPSQIHLQCSLENIPEDAAIFLELRHYRPQKNIISTLCYTFLDRHHLSNERFVCELYTSPVDYTRKDLKNYSEKAFFLHLEVMLRQASCEVQTLDSPKSTASS